MAPSGERFPDAAAARASVCEEAASEEGEVVAWNTFSNPDPIISAFEEAYPGIEVDSLDLRPTEQAQRVLAEHAAGQDPSPDVVTGEANTLLPLFDQGLMDDSVDWPSLGVPEELIHDALNLPLHSRDALGIVYNTDVHEEAEMPDTWDGLIDERWQDLIVVDPRGRPFDQLSLAWGRETTLEYVRMLADLRPLVIEGGTAGMLAVASEQGAITTGGRSPETFEQQANGVPLEIKYLDVVPATDTWVGPLSDSEHPKAAQCWTAWIATDGSEVYFDAEFKSNRLIPVGAPDDIELVVIETDAEAQQVADIGTEIGRIFTGTE